MALAKVIVNYTNVVESELDNLSQSIYNALLNNANFTWAANVLATLRALITDYSNKYEASKNGNKASTTAKEVAKKALLTQLRVMAMQVNVQALGNELKLESSGFTLAKTPSKRGILPKPTSFRVKSGDNSGELLFEVEANADADMYLFYSCATPGHANMDSWRLVPSNKRKINVDGFAPGKQYDLRCAFKGSEEDLVFSDTITLFVQ